MTEILAKVVRVLYTPLRLYELLVASLVYLTGVAGLAGLVYGLALAAKEGIQHGW